MATRTIIRIDEALCNGCAACVTACAEGALAIVDGKAKLVKEQFCDGFGDCLGPCPTGALTIEQRDADGYDPAATRRHVGQSGGDEAVRRFDQAAAAHEQGVHPSDLQQWPVQLHLVAPGAPFFRNRELAVLSTCAPIASADAHRRWIRGRSVVVGCPKLDKTEGYAAKLADILREPTIPKVVIVRMEVPCCGGLTRIVAEAVRLSGRTDLAVEEVTVGVGGDVLRTEPVA